MTAPAAAKTFEPTRKDDPVPNGCKPNNCSLREAFQASNGRQGRDTIVLRKGRYELEVPNGGAGYDNGSLDLVDGFKLRGRGAGKTRIDANGLDQVMTGWSNGAEPDKFSIRDVTLRGGDASAGLQDHGGAVLVGDPDELELASVALIDNFAPTSGGGVGAFGKTTITRSVIAGNQATYGGAVGSRASELTVTKSTISGNTASEGGGVDLRPAAALPVTTILSSTVSGNTATNKAGGILADGNPYGGGDPPEEPELHVTNSTIAGNKAANDAGGIMGDNQAVVDLDNVSVGFNQANDDNVETAVGGGIFQHSSAVFTVNDSVLASNGVGQGGSDQQCSGSFTGTGNVINAPTGCTSFNNPDNTIPATLIANNLADNGGPTETMAVPQGSPAIGYANTCPNRDQRGKLRPNNCDSGSFEHNPRNR